LKRFIDGGGKTYEDKSDDLGKLELVEKVLQVINNRGLFASHAALAEEIVEVVDNHEF